MKTNTFAEKAKELGKELRRRVDKCQTEAQLYQVFDLCRIQAPYAGINEISIEIFLKTIREEFSDKRMAHN